MKLRLAGTVNRLNVEHRTPNIERPILVTLRFIDFKQVNRRISKSSFARAAQALPQRQRLRGVCAACCSVFF